MRRFEADGTHYKLTEEEYTQLLKRFDVENITEHKDGWTRIDLPCICPVVPVTSGGSRCASCASCALGPKYSGCVNILRSLNLTIDDLYLGSQDIEISDDTYDNAYDELKAIHEALLTIPKTK